MYAKTLITLFAAVSAVSARAIVRRSQPEGWWTEGLEDYTTYHERYIALDCQDQHNTTFFDTCCHPLLNNETLADLPSECTPSASASASAASVEETSSVTVSDDEVASATFSATSTSSSATATASDVASTSASASVELNEDYRKHDSSSSSSDYEVEVSTSTSIEEQVWTSTSTSSSTASTSTSTSSSETYTGGYATFYYQDGVAGACGSVNSDSALIAAIDSDRYDSGALCGQQVTITNTENGKSVTVTIADECPTCDNENSIDLSTGAFDEIADESTGIVPITWYFS